MHRQLPGLFYQTQSLFGIKFKKVEVNQNKLIIELAHMFEAVFILNFKVFQFGYRKTKYIKTSASSAESIAWAKQEF